MPDIIDLLSSTPPPPSYQLPLPTSSRRASSTPARPNLLSDDIDISLFTYDDELDNPPKRRRLSDYGDANSNAGPVSKRKPKSSRNSLFLFSDEEVILSSEGPPIHNSSRSNRALPAVGYAEESDPIVFTSSAPEQTSRNTADSRQTDTITIDDDEDGFGAKESRHRCASYGGGSSLRRASDDIEGFSDELVPPDLDALLQGLPGDSPRRGRNLSQLSSRTANVLASLENRSRSTGFGGPSGKTAPTCDDGSDDDDIVILDGANSNKQDKRASRKTNKAASGTDKEAKAREREATKARREQDRRLEKERKQREKEEKAQEKAREKQLLSDLSEANRRKVDKKDSIPEMIVDLAMSFNGTSVGTQAVAFIDSLNVEHSFFESAIPNVVKWRRKVKARFNDSLGYWEPCPLHIRDEEHVLVLLEAQEFVDMVIATDPSAADLTTHVSKLKSVYHNCKPIYLIQGLAPWMRKNKNSRNRAYVAEVRRGMEESGDPQPAAQVPSRRRKPTNKPETSPPVDDDMIEDALLDLQVTHACLIHHTNVAPESAEWIKNFTEHVSTIPYRRERMEGNDSAFCMDGGQVKSGENKTDTYVKMLQEVNRVTASMAYGIAEKYPSVVDLVVGMRRQGPGLLENVKKSTNKNGTLADARIGPAASKRLYKVFMGTNPSSTDI
ncbi:ERCC4 domain-containing protein [Aspergillus ambiguus]|uniref:uncharacterized protein n=1 Tax=Aspergillus ambiguus TaxID=176160 RepID=UPI003CCDF14A